jgi:hypothetical protein
MSRPNSYRLTKSPMTRSCMRSVCALSAHRGQALPCGGIDGMPQPALRRFLPHRGPLGTSPFPLCRLARGAVMRGQRTPCQECRASGAGCRGPRDGRTDTGLAPSLSPSRCLHLHAARRATLPCPCGTRHDSPGSWQAPLEGRIDRALPPSLQAPCQAPVALAAV